MWYVSPSELHVNLFKHPLPLTSLGTYMRSRQRRRCHANLVQKNHSPMLKFFIMSNKQRCRDKRTFLSRPAPAIPPVDISDDRRGWPDPKLKTGDTRRRHEPSS